MGHTEWKDTSTPAFAIEDEIAAEFGLVRNEDVFGTDLYHSESKGRRTYVEIKSIGSKYVRAVQNAEGCTPHSMYFAVTRKAHMKDEFNQIPLLRPGSVFRTCQESPNSLLVVRCPRKSFFDKLYTKSHIVIPECTYYYRAHELMVKLVSLIQANDLKVHRLYPTDKSHKFETMVLVEFAQLSSIALTREEFVTHINEGCPGLSAATAKDLWQDVVTRHSIPVLRNVDMYGLIFNAYLSMNTDPVWRPDWWA
jgi:hypothetical protein